MSCDAAKSLDSTREGLLLHNADGSSLTASYVHELHYRTCRFAGLPERGWHVLRHSFATHAAMFGINPWTLNAWMGHKAMEETMRYVHVAEHHHREIPEVVAAAGEAERDVTKRVIAMLSARGQVAFSEPCGTRVAPQRRAIREVQPISIFN